MNSDEILKQEFDELGKEAGTILTVLHERFGLDHHTALILSALTLASSLGGSAHIVPGNGQILPVGSRVVALDRSGHGNLHHAARWLTTVLRQHNQRLVRANRYQDPQTQEQIRTLHTLILEGDQARSQSLADAMLKSQRRSTDELAELTTGAPIPRATTDGKAAGETLEKDLKRAREILAQSKIQVAEFEVGRRPLMVVRKLSTDLIRHWADHAYDGHLHLIGRGLEAVPALFEGAERDRSLARAFLAQVHGHPPDDVFQFQKQVLESAGFSFCLSMSPAQYSRFLLDSDSRSAHLPESFLLLQSPTQPVKTGKLSKDTNRQVVTFLGRYWSHRLSTTEPHQMSLTDRARKFYDSLCEICPDPDPRNPADPRPWTARLVLTLAASLQILKFKGEVTHGSMLLAQTLIHPRLGEQMEETEAALFQPAPDPKIEQDLERMVGKLNDKGPLTRRELFRTYKRQTQALHLPVLRLGIERGLIREEGGKLIVEGSGCQPVSPSATSNPINPTPRSGE